MLRYMADRDDKFDHFSQLTHHIFYHITRGIQLFRVGNNFSPILVRCRAQHFEWILFYIIFGGIAVCWQFFS